MRYHECIQRSIDFIENNLKDNLSLEEIARQAFLSVSHLYRIFPAMTGCSVGQYIRRRRMTESAYDLCRTDLRIVDVAMQYRFESQESYIRAFKYAFGITPGEYRRHTPMIPLYNRLRLSPLQHVAGFAMQPDIITKKYVLAGMEHEIDLGTEFAPDIAAVIGWVRERLSDIPSSMKAKPVRMVCMWYPFFDGDTVEHEPRTIFFAGVEIVSVCPLPEGMVLKDLPQSLYAVFTEKQRGSIGGIEGYAYREWLPTSGYMLNEDISGDFEVYADIGHISPEQACEILIPISGSHQGA